MPKLISRFIYFLIFLIVIIAIIIIIFEKISVDEQLIDTFDISNFNSEFKLWWKLIHNQLLSPIFMFVTLLCSKWSKELLFVRYNIILSFLYTK